ncbi:MAG: tetratricopeptide repeat protein, partial [Bacteroidota bacterium]
VMAYSYFLRSFIAETPEALAAFRRYHKEATQRLNSRVDTDPYTAILIADIHLLWAMARSKHGEYIRAGWDTNRAYKVLKVIHRDHPDLVLVDKSMSIVHSSVGALQGIQKSMVQLFTALEGTVQEGLVEIDKLYTSRLESPSLIWDVEVIVLRSLMALHIEGDPQLALEIIDQLDPSLRQTALIQFFRGSLLQKLGRASEATKCFCRSWTQDQFTFYYMNLQCGISRLQLMDTSAIESLQLYTAQHPGPNYVKEAYQKLAWYELIIRGSESGYEVYMEKVLQVGDDRVGSDQQALKEARRKKTPHVGLLKARLLYDGGNYSQAAKILSGYDPIGLSVEDRIEWHYRMGRIAQAVEDWSVASFHYGYTIHEGGTSRLYYACNAALQLGIICMDQGRQKQARYYFQRCLELKPDSYQGSLHQKARTRLSLLAGD